MTNPNSTPEKQNQSPTPEEELSDSVELPKRGFFDRIQRGLKAEPVHPSEEKEIVIMSDESN